MVRPLPFKILVCLSLFFSLPLVAQKQILKKLDENSYASITTSRGYHLDVRVQKAADLNAALRIYTGHSGKGTFSSRKYKITKDNDSRAFIPFNSLAPGFQKLFLETLWPEDKSVDGFWSHTILYSGYETLWSVAEIFTGSGRNYPAIKQASGLSGDKVGQGSRLKIPEDLLIEILRKKDTVFAQPDEPIYAVRAELADEKTIVEAEETPIVSAPGTQETHPIAASPEAENTSPATMNPREINETREPVINPGAQDQVLSQQERENTAGQGTATQVESETQPSADPQQENITQASYEEMVANSSARGELVYSGAGASRFAVYRLKAGEAIYSSVIVRFCGLVRAEDVNRVAAEIIEFNKIRDETDLPIGFPIRIPYELLEAEFKAPDDSEYLAWVETQQELAQVSTRLEAVNLEGVYLILDAGHGGRDPGAKFGNVWEDDYVYDIICRIKLRLETETAATIYTTVMDPSVSYKVQDVNRFTHDEDEFLLTRPPFKLSQSTAITDGVNLRWHMANHMYDNLMGRGVKPENVVFTSFHADSLHPALRGSMVYVPDARNFPARVAPKPRFRKYREYKGNDFQNTAAEMLEAQARSMNFARYFIEASHKADLLIHTQKPIRTVIVRNPRTTFVPAVINYNRIPTRCLIEVCNLNNSHDRARLQDPAHRQKVADAYVAAIYKTYGQQRTAAVTKGNSRAEQTSR